MDILKNLFVGFPEFWGGGVAHSVLILSLIVAIGLLLGKLKFHNMSLGLSWVLIVGILFGHFGLTLEPNLLHFVKEVGLIIFVFAIGLQVGPTFFSSFKRGGLALNGLMAIVVAISVVVVLIICWLSGTEVTTMAGIFSGAVTNTPALGAAQQATTDILGVDKPDIAIGYAVAYPMGVLGVIISFIILRYILRINLAKEERDAFRGLGNIEQLTVRYLTLEVSNEMIFGKKLSEILDFINRDFVISRISFADNESECHLVTGETVFHKGDKVMVVTTPKDEDAVSALFGRRTTFNWSQYEHQMHLRQIIVSSQQTSGKTISDLNLLARFSANIVKVTRNGVDHVASPDFKLQTGDVLTVLGSDSALTHVESEVNAISRKLTYPNLIPIFIGLALGCILAHVPFVIPGIPQPVRFGLAGGPLIIAILMGYFGSRHDGISFSAMNSVSLLREIGISVFLACVGLQAGKDFVDTVVTSQGLTWAGYGLIITMVPVLLGGIIGRLLFHINFFTLLGVLSGSNTNPPALAYANDYTATDAPSVGYTMVYPVAMFLRIILIQIILILLCN